MHCGEAMRKAMRSASMTGLLFQFEFAFELEFHKFKFEFQSLVSVQVRVPPRSSFTEY